MNVLQNPKGFSLTEILIALALLGIIGTFVTTNLIDQMEEGKVNTAKIRMANLSLAIKEYRRKCGIYPSTNQGLEALLSKPTSGEDCKNYPENGFLPEEIQDIPLDPWDEPYYYESPASNGRNYQIYSYGGDKQEGGEGTKADIYYPPLKRGAKE